MVILIGGVSCTGKTLMAQSLLEKYKMPYLSIDHLKMGLVRGNKYCDFSATDSDDDIANKLWPIVKGIIMTNIENGQNIIIEGCYLPPEHIRDFGPEYLEQIIALYIGFSRHYLENHFISGILVYRDAIELRQNDSDDYLNLKNFSTLHAQIKERCYKSNAKYFEINDDYENEIEMVYKWIDEKVEAKKIIYEANPIDEKTRRDVINLITEHWGSPTVVSRGKIHSAENLPGFIIAENGKLKGLITYNIVNDDCEIVTLVSLIENKGIGSLLIDKVIKAAQDNGCKRVWLITTNDNTHAIRFYQKRGFNLSGIYLNAIAQSRKIKPQIPLYGFDDIPVLHEIEFEIML